MACLHQALRIALTHESILPHLPQKGHLPVHAYLQHAMVDINLRGNPTHSTTINDVITKVKKYEVRQEGVSSEARCGLKWEEFYALLVLAHHLYATVDLCFFYGRALPSMANYWLH